MIHSALLQYWDNIPNRMDYFNPNCWIRSGYLVNYISTIERFSKTAKIFEIGSGVGRNLAVLKFAGYDNLSGLELSQKSIDIMHSIIPLLANNNVHQGPVEEILYSLMTDAFDLVFTMAVLEHLPTESEHVFKQIARITKKYLLTIEDEIRSGPYHFPRDYKKVFEKYGLKQIGFQKKIPGLSHYFRLRLFIKEGSP